MIEINNLTKKFRSKIGDCTVLNHVSINVNKGDVYGVIGMSGAGKSTLLRCVGLLEDVSDGEILIGGENLSQLDRGQKRKARKNIGIIFQGYHLLAQKTVYKNIAFPLEISGWEKKDIKDRVEELLELVGLSDKKNAYPSELSGGQKQRVAIARALANNAEVLLCDEPTSALDLVTIESILSLLKKLNRELGVTILLITHELSVIKSICNRVAVIDEGIVVEEGAVGKVFAHPEHRLTKELLQFERGVIQ